MSAPVVRFGARWRQGVATLGLAALALAPRAALALTDEEVFRQLRFNQSMPGARTLGMGGAFIGLADDAAAAAYNPGGLGFLTRPQVMLEARLADMDDEVAGELAPFPLNDISIGSDRWRDGRTSLLGIASGSTTFEREADLGLSYAAYVHPVNDKLVVAFSRHERLNFERNSTSAWYSSDFGALEGSGATSRQAMGNQGTLDLMYDTYNISVASAFIDQLSVGVTIGLARLDVDARHGGTGYAFADTNANGLLDQYLQPADYETWIDDDDTQFTFSAGLLYKPHRKIGIGLVYRDGPVFDVLETIGDAGARAADLREYFSKPLPDGTIVANVAGEFMNRFAMPDEYGIGFSFGPFFEPERGKGGLTIAADAVRIEYSDVLDGFVAGLNEQLFAAYSQGVTFAAEDATEFHLGLNWTWTVGYNNSIHVRLGGYTDPSHTIYANGRTVTNGVTGGAVVVGSVPETDDQTHFTLGAGFTLKRGFHAFTIDAAADFSDLGNEYVGTASYKF